MSSQARAIIRRPSAICHGDNDELFRDDARSLHGVAAERQISPPQLNLVYRRPPANFCDRRDDIVQCIHNEIQVVVDGIPKLPSAVATSNSFDHVAI
jgi:hypothetical protein